uniref:Uncharacterized protein n=1 Tax=Anguilla anguilla TaxID=7936 RepID=A0A0E9PJM4_ANGAN
MSMSCIEESVYVLLKSNRITIFKSVLKLT